MRAAKKGKRKRERERWWYTSRGERERSFPFRWSVDGLTPISRLGSVLLMASLGNWSLSILFLDPPIVHFHLFLPSLSHSSGTSFSASSFFSLKILRRLVRALQSKGKESVGLTRRNQTEEWWWVCSHRLDCAPARAWTRQWARGGAALINTADNNNNSITIAGSIETAFAKRIAIDWFKFLGHFSFFFPFLFVDTQLRCLLYLQFSWTGWRRWGLLFHQITTAIKVIPPSNPIIRCSFTFGFSQLMAHVGGMRGTTGSVAKHTFHTSRTVSSRVDVNQQQTVAGSADRGRGRKIKVETSERTERRAVVDRVAA